VFTWHVGGASVKKNAGDSRHKRKGFSAKQYPSKNATMSEPTGETKRREDTRRAAENIQNTAEDRLRVQTLRTLRRGRGVTGTARGQGDKGRAALGGRIAQSGRRTACRIRQRRKPKRQGVPTLWNRPSWSALKTTD